MTEEIKLADEKGIESPICHTIEDTNKNYNRTIEILFENYQEGDKICFATHNIDSLILVGEMNKKKPTLGNIFCAQLLGIAQHATGIGKQMDLVLAKYIPFGDFNILIPYLMRRAEESAMIQKLRIQNELLNEELLYKIGIKKEMI